MKERIAAALPFEETCLLDSTALRDKQFAPRRTRDGYMVCMPRVARTGIQIYRGAEVGMPDLDQVRVYRPHDEVFAGDAVRSLSTKPVTIEHPSVPVNADNWKDYAVGSMGEDVLRDGQYMRAPMILMDAAAIKEVQSGRAQISVGYEATLKWGDGVTPEGEPYDAKQTAIRANHVAITHTARGGPLLRMGDRAQQERAMKRIFIDGVPVELDERDATVVERHIKNIEKDLDVNKNESATAQTSLQRDVAVARTETQNALSTVQNKDAEIATLKQQIIDCKMTPEKLDQMLADREATKHTAQKILGDSVTISGRSDAEIRRQVVNTRMGDMAKSWSDDMVLASFMSLADHTVTSDSFNNGNGTLQHVVNVVAHNNHGVDQRAKAYEDYDKAISNRWKTAGIRQAV